MQSHFIPQLIKPISFVGGLFLINLLFLFLGFYEKYTYLDDIVHFLGGSSIALFSFQLITIFSPQSKMKHKLLLTILVTFIVAVLWEIMEFSSDLLIGSRLQLGLNDTIADLFIGVMGAVALVLVAWKISRLTSDTNTSS